MAFDRHGNRPAWWELLSEPLQAALSFDEVLVVPLDVAGLFEPVLQVLRVHFSYVGVAGAC